LSSQFARQFGYDKIYVGNSNLGLRFSDNLYEGARVWYFNVAGGTEARFNLPQKIPNSYTSLRFCARHVIADSVPEYNINNSCIGQIKAMFQAKKGSKNIRLKGMDEFLRAKLEAGQMEAAGYGEKPVEEPYQKCSRGELRSVLDLSLLRLARVKRDTMGACD